MPCIRFGIRFIIALLALSFAYSGWTQSRAPQIQSVDIVVPVAPAAVAISGRRHLAYELHITNFTSDDVELKSVAVLNGAERNLLGEFQDSTLAAMIGVIGATTPTDKPSMIAGGRRAVVYFWLPLADAEKPASLVHQLRLEKVGKSGRESLQLMGGATPILADSPPLLGPPLRGGPWVALYDPSMAHGHRTSIYTIEGRARIPARFAIDFIRLHDDATHAAGDETQVKNWYGYGAEVLAVADGVIVEARDDIQQFASISDSQGNVALENASGNYVVLKLGNNRYAFYEHLQQGSVRVKAGDRVSRGQVIGQLGNTGSSSSGPHLHFHVADAQATLAAEGQPWAFSTFDVIGQFADIDQFVSGARWGKSASGKEGSRSRELPDANVVVMFPDRATER